MNDLVNTTANGPTAMSSVEIAELTGKRHDNVMRDIRLMLEGLGGALKFEGTYKDAQGKEQACFHLPKRETLILVSGYKVELRAKIIDRLDELENRHQSVTVNDLLSNPAQLLAITQGYALQIEEMKREITEMKPAVEALEQIAEAHGSFSRTEAAKHLGVPPHVLIKWLRTNGWTYHRPGSKDDLAYQSKINSGYLEHKVATGPRPDGTEWVSNQIRVTPKGLTILAKAFPVSARAA